VFTGATHAHPTSIDLNPAALGTEQNTELYFELSGLLDYYSIDRDAPLARGDQSVTGTELGAGGILAAIIRPGGRYHVSLEIRLPPPELFPQDHDELKYFTLGQRQRDILSSIAATIRATNRLYFGATLTHHNTFLRLKYARDTAAANGDGPDGISSDCGGAPCGFENPEAAESYNVGVRSPYVSTANLKFTLGALVRIYRQVWLGVSYHVPPGFNIQSELEGDAEIRRAPRDGGMKLPAESVVDVSYPASVDAEVKAELPNSLNLFVAGRWEDLARMQAYDVRLVGNQLAAANIPEWQLRTRGMHDSFAFWGGIEQRDRGQPILAGGRIGFESSSVSPDRTTALTIAPASLTLDGGVQFRRGQWIAQVSYGLQYFIPVTVTDSNFDPRFYGDCIASEFDYSTRACTGVREGYAIASGAGDYGRMLHSLRVGFRYVFP
jgi:hypothetical protein